MFSRLPAPAFVPDGAMASVRFTLPVPAAFVAMSTTVKSPATVGVPEISPLVVLIERLAGKPVAP